MNAMEHYWKLSSRLNAFMVSCLALSSRNWNLQLPQMETIIDIDGKIEVLSVVTTQIRDVTSKSAQLTSEIHKVCLLSILVYLS